MVELGAERTGTGAIQLGTIPSLLPLADPVVAGDTLYVRQNLGIASYDLTPLWLANQMPVYLGGSANVDELRPGKMILSGPFAYMNTLSGFRVFDLR